MTRGETYIERVRDKHTCIDINKIEVERREREERERERERRED